MAMQSIFRLPWGSDPLENRPDAVSIQKMRSSPMVDIPLLNKLKRKRTDSPEPAQPFLDIDAKRRKLVEGAQGSAHNAGKRDTTSIQPSVTNKENEQISPVSYSKAMPPPPLPLDTNIHIPNDFRSRPHNMEPETALQTQNPIRNGQTGTSWNAYSNLSPVQQIIEQQFNVEILSKHRELRLIDQELAKCQIALEQLRRCELVPYPGLVGMSEDVSFGRGPSVRAQPGWTQPSTPSPWGVTDGPYTRHYAKWLLPDPSFDSSPIAQMPAVHDSPAAARADGRSTRNSIVSLGRTSKRGNRESFGSITQSQVVQAPQPQPARNKGGPLVIKRMSDNQFVKLVCTKCHRGDFSSVQGFLNHCRIAHKLEYKSHEAAAQDCGHLLEEHEQELSATAPPPVGSIVRSSVPKTTTAHATPSVSRVHPLNSQIPHRPTWKHQIRAYEEALSRSQSTLDTSLANVSSVSSTFHSAPLIPSSSTPALSALFAKRGLGGDLKSATANAKEQVDLGLEDGEEGEADVDTKASPSASTDVGVMRTVSGGSKKSMVGGQQSSKGHRQIQRPRPAPISSQRPSDASSLGSPQELSPHTADSNPGLVSDHDDDPSDPEDDSGSVIAPSHSISIGRGCGDAMDLDLEVDEDHDEHSVLVRARNIRDREIHGAGSPSRPRSRYDDSRK